MPVTVCLISLGCAKNLVDSEHMLAYIKDAGMGLTSNPADADVAVVNTCGFIESAKTEAIETILSVAELKKNGRLTALIVTGCLSERYRAEIRKEMPEVDGVLGTGSYHQIVSAIREALEGRKAERFDSPANAPLEGERILASPQYTAYLKIAEGCDNRCAYCVIPSLRGPFRSRPMESVVNEAKTLAGKGVSELIVVAQDTTRYGTDLCGTRKLPELLTALCQIEGIRWIRLHYLYPDEIDDRLLDVIAAEEKVLRYFDIPIQHVSDRILSAMNRRGNKQLITALFRKIRQKMPDAVIRTSLITGLPGETEEEFVELCDFLREMKLPRVGVFCYSPEDGSPAAELPGQVDKETKEKRQAVLIELQSRIADEWNLGKTGHALTVLVEGYDRDRTLYFGRSYADSPDIDGKVYFSSELPAVPGEFVRVVVQSALDFDLFGVRKT